MQALCRGFSMKSDLTKHLETHCVEKRNYREEHFKGLDDSGPCYKKCNRYMKNTAEHLFQFDTCGKITNP